jgi:hypothetical protein
VDTFRRNLKLATLGDLDRDIGLVTSSGSVLDLLDDVIALEDLAEDNMTAIQPPGTTVSISSYTV